MRGVLFKQQAKQAISQESLSQTRYLTNGDLVDSDNHRSNAERSEEASEGHL